MTPFLRAARVALLVFGCGPAVAPLPDRPAASPEPAAVAAQPAPAPAASEPAPPVAAIRPYQVQSPHGNRNDPYYWLRDDTRKSPDVIAYLEAENAYAGKVLGSSKPLEDKLFAEMKSRIQEDDSSVPVFEDGYWYYTRFETGKQYPIQARRKGTLEASEEILLDGNQLAVGHPFYAIGGWDVTRNGRLLVWADDTVGRNQFTMHVKDLQTGELLPDAAANIAPGFVWANDNKTIFYVGKDPVTLRTDRVFRHTLGGAPVQVFKEDDGQYYVGIAPSKSRKYVMIVCGATTNSEYRLIDADRPTTAAKTFIPRSKDHLYFVDHLDGRFVMRTNVDGAKNFRLVEIPPGAEAAKQRWKDVIPHSADLLVESFALYHDFIAASVRTAGLRKVRVLPRGKPAYFIDAPDKAYAMTVTNTPDPDSKRVRYAYDSMTSPNSVFEADVATRQIKLLKQQPVPGYDASQYASDYLHATAKDGTRVPISVVYKKGTRLDGSAPLLIYGYGSYGLSQEPRFSLPAVSLLDRGWVYAIAHIRGGEEMGRAWYEAGKLMNKANTFTDFIAVTEHLVANKLGAPDRVFAYGGSAGGLLIGAIINLRPDLYRGVVALVPFVDVVTTMLDETIPLTTNEFDEWGNPKATKAEYDYMLSYSPYDNIKAANYPSIYVQTGLHDSQVQYFEPAKWVAKLRATKADRNLLVMDVDMSSGHGGASGRFNRLRQTARAYSFLLHVHDQPDARRAR